MPAEFPLPSVSANNPIPLYFDKEPTSFRVERTIYDDEGADYKLQNGGNGVQRWIIRYDGLTIAQFQILDNWVATMYYSEESGSAYGANLRHHVAGTLWSDTSGTLFSGVHIAAGGYKKSHTKVWSQMVEFVLEKRP